MTRETALCVSLLVVCSVISCKEPPLGVGRGLSRGAASGAAAFGRVVAGPDAEALFLDRATGLADRGDSAALRDLHALDRQLADRVRGFLREAQAPPRERSVPSSIRGIRPLADMYVDGSSSAPARILGYGALVAAEEYQATTEAQVTYHGNQGGSSARIKIYHGTEITPVFDQNFTGVPYLGSQAPCAGATSGDCSLILKSVHTFPVSHSEECDYHVDVATSHVAYWQSLVPFPFAFGHVYAGLSKPSVWGPTCNTTTGGSDDLECRTETVIVEVSENGGPWNEVWRGYVEICDG